MGLDFVELVMELEDQYGIVVRLDELQSTRTVGDLAAIVCSRVVAATDRPCETLRQFLLVRRLLRELRGEPELRVRPTDSMDAAVPVRQRRDFWRVLSDLAGFPLPALRRPRWLRRGLVAGSLVLLLIVVGAAMQGLWPCARAGLAIAGWAAGVVVLNQMTLRFRSELPTGWRTCGDVARQLAGAVVATRRPDHATAASLFTQVRDAAARVAGIDPLTVTRESRLIEDLGLG